MSGQLLKVTTTPFQAVRFSQSARLVSSDSADLERRKAIARMKAFQSQHSSAAGNIDMKYVNRINQTFSVLSASRTPASSAETAPQMTTTDSSSASGSSVPVKQLATNVSASSTANGITVPSAVSSEQMAVVDSSAVIQENNASYTAERGAFEFRVATGELSFLPSLTMTVITQRPEVHFEYLGGYHYVPASKFNGDIMTLSV